MDWTLYGVLNKLFSKGVLPRRGSGKVSAISMWEPATRPGALPRLQTLDHIPSLQAQLSALTATQHGSVIDSTVWTGRVLQWAPVEWPLATL